jgi:putative tributyrin esterase
VKRFRTVEITDVDLRAGGRADATVFSPALGGRVDCSFWIPPGTDGVPLPLVVLLHGVYGSHWAWFGRGAADRAATDLVATGRLPACVIASPSDGLLGHGSGYVRQPGADVPTWILDEVPELAAIVSADVDPEGAIALIGLSMGGFGALRLAATAGADGVRAAVGLSSITAIEQMALFGVDPLPTTDAADQRSIVAALDDHGHDVGALRVVCGRADLLVEHNRRLHFDLDRRGIPHDWVEDDGRHEWSYWRRHLPAALEFVGGRLTS